MMSNMFEGKAMGIKSSKEMDMVGGEIPYDFDMKGKMGSSIEGGGTEFLDKKIVDIF